MSVNTHVKIRYLNDKKIFYQSITAERTSQKTLVPRKTYLFSKNTSYTNYVNCGVPITINLYNIIPILCNICKNNLFYIC